MAAQGLRDVGDGQEAVANPKELAALRARGRRVTWVTWATAIIATAGLYAAVRW